MNNLNQEKTTATLGQSQTGMRAFLELGRIMDRRQCKWYALLYCLFFLNIIFFLYILALNLATLPRAGHGGEKVAAATRVGRARFIDVRHRGRRAAWEARLGNIFYSIANYLFIFKMRFMRVPVDGMARLFIYLFIFLKKIMFLRKSHLSLLGWMG